MVNSLNSMPDGREEHTAVWTGVEMIVWGGWDNVTGAVATGGRYNPETETWQTLPDTTLEGRYAHTAIWTGREEVAAREAGIYDEPPGLAPQDPPKGSDQPDQYAVDDEPVGGAKDGIGLGYGQFESRFLPFLSSLPFSPPSSCSSPSSPSR